MTRLRIGMLAPPWIPVPPPGYGGIESVVALLTRELVREGHDVTLFAPPGSRSEARLCPPLDRPHPDEIERSLYEADHCARAFALIDEEARLGRAYHVLHDHCGFTPLAMADRLATPLVHTLHGPFKADEASFYAHHASKAHVVAISQTQLQAAPAGMSVTAVVPNPIDVQEWPLQRHKEPYLLWVGRMAVEKGAHRAIAAARLAAMRLVLAGPVQRGQDCYFDREVAPHLDGERVSYVGEISGAAKQRLFARASSLLMPIRWAEPFGMVMIEAMACGTPVIAFPEGAAREVVQDGQTGFLVDDEQQMADACRLLGEIDPLRCRSSVVERYDVRRVAGAYVRIYKQACEKSVQSRSAAPKMLTPRMRHAVGARRGTRRQAQGRERATRAARLQANSPQRAGRA